MSHARLLLHVHVLMDPPWMGSWEGRASCQSPSVPVLFSLILLTAPGRSSGSLSLAGEGRLPMLRHATAWLWGWVSAHMRVTPDPLSRPLQAASSTLLSLAGCLAHTSMHLLEGGETGVTWSDAANLNSERRKRLPSVQDHSDRRQPWVASTG